MTVYKCGTIVNTVLGNIEGIIVEASISNLTLYKISYFHNGDHKTAWLNEYEFTVANGKKQTIGFHK